ncbi:LytTR family DNA-binding domain-containing protein [Gymnodinialimonas ulvae]|uniref:LytTR family DNA-binding domain-containing protein n=1 Tax=Gymnodinialimonas ulvae TaxID=3126504 RepID=UPI00309DB11D
MRLPHPSGTLAAHAVHRAFVNHPELFVSDVTSSSALRDLRDHLRHPKVWLACLGVAVMVALVGPFDTDDSLTLPARLAYWGVVVPVSYGIGAFTGYIAAPLLARRLPRVLVAGLSGALTGTLIYLFILALNAALFGLRPTWAEVPAMLALFMAIAFVVSFLIGLLPAVSGETGAPGPKVPPLLERVPLDKRGALLALSSEDHYTRIQTTKGAEMVLLRLADAIRETAPEPGLRVHRSHWVALGAVTAARRDGERAILTLTGGTEIPVSRANVPAIREAGLLPR